MELILISRKTKRSPQKILIKPDFMGRGANGLASVYETRTRKERADTIPVFRESQRREIQMTSVDEGYSIRDEQRLLRRCSRTRHAQII